MKKKLLIIAILIVIILTYTSTFYITGTISIIKISQESIIDHLNKVLLNQEKLTDYITNKEEIKEIIISPVKAIKQAFTIDKRIIAVITTALTIIILYKLIILIIFNEQIANYIGLNKLIRDKKGTFGTAKWAEKKDIQKMKHEKTLETERGIVIGSTKKPYTGINKYKNKLNIIRNNNLKYRLTVGPKAQMMNSHAIVISGSGGGKTFSFALPNAVNSVKENTSVLFTDPKGELLQLLAGYYIKNGYEVKTLNLVDLDKSDRFNPIDLIESELDALLFTHIILTNTNIDLDMTSSGDPFWEKGETNLLKALVLYLKSSYPKEQQNMGNLYDLILDSDIKKLERIFSKVDNDTAMKRAYKVYASGDDEKIRAGIIIGLGSRLQIFQHEDIRRITEANDIDIYNLKKKNAAFFLVIPDTHSAYDYLPGIFMNFLLVKLPALHDKTKDEAIKNKKLRVIADEIANVGKIANLEKVITTLRSRNIDLYPIYQDIAQIQKAFDDNWETIVGNCDTLICLGSNDEKTTEYISKKLGFQTLKTISKNKTDGLSELTKIKRWSISEQKRELMQPSEISKMNKLQCIVFIRGEEPLKLWKYGFDSCPEYKEVIESKIDYIPQYKQASQSKISQKEFNLTPEAIAVEANTNQKDIIDSIMEESEDVI